LVLASAQAPALLFKLAMDLDLPKSHIIRRISCRILGALRCHSFPPHHYSDVNPFASLFWIHSCHNSCHARGTMSFWILIEHRDFV
jgi:hypothetical protein